MIFDPLHAIPALFIFARVFTAIKITPFLGFKSIPWMPAAGIAILFTIISIQSIQLEQYYIGEVVPIAITLLREILTGAIMGISARWCWSIFEISGSLINSSIWGENANQEQRALTIFIPIMGSAIFVLQNGHQVILGALWISFKLFPTHNLFSLDSTLYLLAGIFSSSFLYGLLLAAPLLICRMVTDLLSTIISKSFQLSTANASFNNFKLLAGNIILIGMLWIIIEKGVYFLFKKINIWV